MNTRNRSGFRGFGFYAVLILIVVLIWYGLSGNTTTSSYTKSDFQKALQKNDVTYVKVVQNREIPTGSLRIKLKDGTQQYLYASDVNEMQNLMDDEKFDNYTLEDVPAESWIMTLLPYLLIFGAFFILFVIMNNNAAANSGGGKMMNFGKSRAKLSTEEDNKTSFANVAGLREEKEELEELVDFLRDPKKYTKLGARIPKGVLLVGPPGTGKTLLAKAVAGEAGVPFFSISGSDFVEMFVGVGASRVRDLFEDAKKNAPCIVFIDEIDAVARRRGTGMGGGHDEREQTLNQLLVEMDGFEGNEGVIILAATNRADVLDPALLRPGRFDRQIRVSNPDKRARSQILKVHARNKHFAPDVDFDNIAQRTPGFSGAELANVLNEAALLAVRSGHQMITLSDVDEAIDRVIGGPAKKSRKYTEHERKLVAYHETGHAIIGLTLEDANQVQKVTIVPRGDAGGYNLMTPREETYFSTKKQLLATITGYMGGRTAEEIFFGDVSSGAHNDIEQATRIARMMVTELGMSELGPIKYDSGDNAVFLGRDYSQLSNTHSGQIAFEIDQQVRKIIETAHAQATEIINNNKDKMDIIANALLEHETLNHEQIQSLYNTGKMPETYDGTEEHVESNDDNNNTPEPPKADPEDDLLDEMK